jgi:predicted Zn-dependent protease
MRNLTLLVAAAAVPGIWTTTPSIAWAHGELHEQIADVTHRIDQELRRPPYPDAGHERSKFYLERAELHRLHHAWKAAEADYDQAIRWEPDHDDVELCRGKMLLEAGQPGRARPVLESYLARHVDHPEALLVQAQVLVALGEGANAVRFLDRALTRHPQPEPDHYLARVTILESLGERHLPRAVRGLDAGIRKLGPIVSLDEKGIALDVRLRRYDRALARVDRQAARSPRKDMWLARRADVLEQAGRAAQARRTRQQALQAIAALPPTLQGRPDTQSLKQRLLTSPHP